MTNTSTDTQPRAPLQVGATAAAGPAGQVGDFDFLSGEWKIRHRRLKDGQWDMFDGEATVVGILGGIASVEELRIPSRNFSGLGLRLLDTERRLWADYWLNGTNGILQAPTWGGFSNGAGTWDAHETDSKGALVVRGVWDRITATSVRWTQAQSRDGGKTWEENWIMLWARA